MSQPIRTRCFAFVSLTATVISLSSCSGDGSSPSAPAARAALRGGASWQPMPGSTSELLWSVWSAKDEVIAVGTGGTADHLKNGAWNTKTSGVDGSLCDVWMNIDGSALAVGVGGVILRYNGNTWSSMNSGTTNDLFDVFGFQNGRAYAVGANGTVLSLTGSVMVAALSLLWHLVLRNGHESAVRREN